MKLTKIILVLIGFFISINLFSQTNKRENFAHTFSIVARDVETGEMAVGVQSHWFSVGTLVSWGKSGVGVVATQSFINPAYGPNGIAMMETGKSATNVLNKLVSEDEGKDFRQVAMLDVNGDVSAFTGAKCIKYANQIIGDNYSVQANMMLNDKVVPAMSKAFKKYKNLPLAERILKVLQVAQEAGGDIRGRQSASLIVVNSKSVENIWEEHKIDLRVDDHENPLVEIERLLKIHHAYEHMNNGDLAIENNDMKLALKEYGSAEKLMPDNLEMKYWKAIALANNNQVKKSLPLFKKVFAEDENWRELTKRLPKSGLLNVSKSDLNVILELENK
ncbi:MAG: DUF1028 domain-containing protein [Candidatus Marinimicrobia bacterium]|nr:DUF1028 domain-containing protein [Candidatus Neomarinimicrobiota bacterium]